MSEICIRSYYAETRDLKYNKEFMKKLITAIAELCESRCCNFNINFDSNDSNHLHVKIVDWGWKACGEYTYEFTITDCDDGSIKHIVNYINRNINENRNKYIKQ